MTVMPDSAHVAAFVLFAATAAGSPGPSNALLTAVGARVGMRRGLPSLLGQVAGMGSMLFVIALGPGSLLLAHPLVLEILRWGGAALLCWMAWRIATARPAADDGSAAPAGFLGMAAFQWVNPKGWLVAAAAVASFLDRRSGGALAQAVTYTILFVLVAVPSCWPWLGFGAVLRRFVMTPRSWRVLHIAMAAALVAATVLLVWR